MGQQMYYEAEPRSTDHTMALAIECQGSAAICRIVNAFTNNQEWLIMS